MKNTAKHLLLFLALIVSPSFAQLTIDADHENIIYWGRVDHSNPKSPAFEFPGITIKAKFTGTSVSAILNDFASHGETTTNYFYKIIDGGAPEKFEALAGTNSYELATGLTAGEHTVELIKLTEASVGRTAFEGFIIDNGASIISLDNEPECEIEFIGNSITCGYGNEISTTSPETGFHSINENNYEAYGYQTARNLGLRYKAVSYSGRGLYRNNSGQENGTLPKIYDKIYPDAASSPTWNHGASHPSVIVINLGTNDFAQDPASPVDAERFKNTYVDFVETLLDHHTHATVICATGVMMSDWWPENQQHWTKITTYVQDVVDSLNNLGHSKVHYFQMEPQSSPYGEDYHPTIATQTSMATSLTAFINNLGETCDPDAYPSTAFSISKLFNDGMLLQQGVNMPVWGTSAAGDDITIEFQGQTETVTTNSSGEWEVTLAPLSAGGPYDMTVSVNASPYKTYTDVYVGDVWIAAGQSNMEWTLSNTDNGTTEIAAANDQEIRQFKIPKGLQKELSSTLPGGSWTAATSANVGSWSAVAYHFAKNIKSTAGVPIGIVNATYGGARIEAFMSEEMLGFDEDYTVLQPANYYPERQPTMIYNSMINPLHKFPIKGFIWYQGESNSDQIEDAKSYGALFKKMITSWREEWGQGDLPFLWVNLPNVTATFGEDNPQTWDSWQQMRRSQSSVLTLPNTGEVIAIDLGEEDIHPTLKKPVGERLAVVGEAIAYGQNVEYLSPRYESYEILPNGHVIITFKDIYGGLEGLTGNAVKWFSIAGSNNVLARANAEITGTNTVEVWNDNITDPTIVRYAWELNPEGVDLYNSADLPAAPFYITTTYPDYAYSFDVSDLLIERGQPVLLDWSAQNVSSVTINGEMVDSISAQTVYPSDTTTYTFKVVSREDPLISDSVLVTVNVIDPQPTISIRSTEGTAIAMGTETSILANVEAPGGGTITQVEFIINGISTAIDTEAPFELPFSSDTLGEFEIVAEVTDQNGNTANSNLVNLSVTDLKILVWEAEDAIKTGAASAINFSGASGGKLLDVLDVWSFTFDAVTAPEDGSYQLTIVYQLAYEGPKSQKMFVNGAEQSVVFEGADASAIYQTRIDVDLVAGTNEIRFEQDWAWMRFDYISIAVEDGAIIPPSVKAGTNVGEITAPNETIKLTADITTEESTVTSVEFFVDGIPYETITSTPYEVDFTPTEAKDYSIEVKVVDSNNSEATSSPFVLSVTALDVITLEAEDATLTGAATIKTNGSTSGGEYVEVQQDWSITWNNINVSEAGTYQVTIGYQLTFEGPKTQKLLINGVAQDVVFEADNSSDWLTKNVDVTFAEGINTLSFEPSWAWMSFDFVKLFLPPNEVGINDATKTNINVYPNPTSNSIFLEQSSNWELYSAHGLLLNNSSSDEIDLSDYDTGMYIIKTETGISRVIKQ